MRLRTRCPWAAGACTWWPRSPAPCRSSETTAGPWSGRWWRPLQRATRASREREVVGQASDVEQADGGRLRVADPERLRCVTDLLAGPDHRAQSGGVDEADLREIEHQLLRPVRQRPVERCVERGGGVRGELA